MKTSNLFIVLTIAATSIFTMACIKTTETSNTTNDNMTSEVLTPESQANLTPVSILEGLKEGNERFMNNNLTNRDYAEQAKKTASGQYPEAVILSCIDSRIPVEQVFDKGVGDIFVARVAGNFVNEDILGSLEFSTAVAGSKVVVVMGHKSCGAVKSAIDDVEMGNITAMLEKIKPAIEMTSSYSGDKSSANEEFVTEVVNNNVQHTISEIRSNSPIIEELEKNGDVVLVGAFYDLETGKVTFME